MNRSTRRPVRGLVTAAVSTVLLASALGVAVPATANQESGESPRRKPTVIRVRVDDQGPKVRRGLLGVNHRYSHNGFGLWDPKADQPVYRLVEHIRRAGVSVLRFPGGTTATMYHWKQAIGPVGERGCQIEGHGHHQEDGFKAVQHGLAYGPDEFMRVSNRTGAAPLIMMPFVTQTPGDAAAWVEYMNTRVGKGNPGGGVDWARVRARNGHPRPYDVQRWEVGNESHVAPGRFGFASKPSRALKQYINGGTRRIHRESLGKACAHPFAGIRSDGTQNQLFEVLFTPARTSRVFVGGKTPEAWHEVSAAQLGKVGPRRKVYAVLGRGTVLFGDGHQKGEGWVGHGLIPPEGATVKATYRNRYAGFFDFAREMHEVDSSIDVCASWGTPAFSKEARGRRYDCQTAHPITNFSRKPGHNWRSSTDSRRWDGPLEGHDRMMLGLADRTGDVREMLRGSPRRSPLWLTEFQPIHGDDETYPSWSTSMSNGTYMASQWASWLRLGIKLGTGGDLIGRGRGAVFGAIGKPVFSVDAMVRLAIRPMFNDATRVVGSATRRNPVRSPDLRPRDSYKAVAVAAARSHGKVWVLVVNRLPRDGVQARIRLSGMNAARKATVRRVVGKNFRTSNELGQAPSVRMQASTRRVDKDGFSAKLPAHSVTVYRVRIR